jgi:hypothetical protein
MFGGRAMLSQMHATPASSAYMYNVLVSHAEILLSVLG